MKAFMKERVFPKIQSEQRLRWITEYSNGPTVSYAVDMAVYTKNIAFRMIHAKKGGKTSVSFVGM